MWFGGPEAEVPGRRPRWDSLSGVHSLFDDLPGVSRGPAGTGVKWRWRGLPEEGSEGRRAEGVRVVE